MKTTVIYLIRHCEPDFKFSPNSERPLTETRLRDAETLADKGIELIYSSPYRRAVETDAPLSERLGSPVITESLFREREGGHGSETFEEFNRRQWTDLTYKRPCAESIGEAQLRILEGIGRLLREYTGKTAAVSSHGAAISSVVHFYQPEFGYEGFLRVIDFMPWVVKLEYSGTSPDSLTSIEEVFHIHRPYSG